MRAVVRRATSDGARVPRVIVVGGGAAGLAAAAELCRLRCAVVLVEARDRLGGRVDTRSDPVLGMAVERGAEFVHGHPQATLALAQRSGARLRRIPDRHARRRAGRLVDSAGELARAQALLRLGRSDDEPFTAVLRRAGARARARRRPARAPRRPRRRDGAYVHPARRGPRVRPAPAREAQGGRGAPDGTAREGAAALPAGAVGGLRSAPAGLPARPRRPRARVLDARAARGTAPRRVGGGTRRRPARRPPRGRRRAGRARFRRARPRDAPRRARGSPRARGGYAVFPVGSAGAQEALARSVEGTLFFAGEATAGGHAGTVDGALRSGERAAREVAASLRRYPSGARSRR